MGIRPEHLDRDAAPDITLDVTVDVIEQLGGTSYLYGRLASGDPIVIERRDNSGVKAGQTVKVGLKMADARFFDEAGLRLK
jgi:lactose/L-arabinose transport system ATP-binding protein